MQLLNTMLVAAATLRSIDGLSITGGKGNDNLVGTKEWDFIKGKGGNDKVNGKQGDDIIYGNGGNDRLSGSRGSDYVYGNAGGDVVHGGKGFDYLGGEAGNDHLYGDKGPDILYGDGNFYFEVAEPGDDVLHGGPGPDLLIGGGGNDKLYVDTGELPSTAADHSLYDSVYPESGADLIVLGPVGDINDTVHYFGYDIAADQLAGAAPDVIQNFDRTMDTVEVNLLYSNLTPSMIIGIGEFLVLKRSQVSYRFAQLTGQNVTALLEDGRILVTKDEAKASANAAPRHEWGA